MRHKTRHKKQDTGHARRRVIVHAVTGVLFGGLIRRLLTLGARKVTKYVTPRLTVKATRQGRWRAQDRQQTILLTVGKPNYAERAFIKTCQKAGESFPVKKLQIRY